MSTGGESRAVATVPGQFFVGHLLRFRRDPLGALVACARAGGLVRVRVLNVDVYVVSEPALLQHVLQDNYRNYTKQTATYMRGYDLLGQGLLTSDGEHWLRQRRLMQPAFHKQRVAGFADTMRGAAIELADEWATHARAGEAFDLAADMTRVTMTIVGNTLLGADVEGDVEQVSRAFAVASEAVARRSNQVWAPPLWWPTPATRRYAAAIRALDEVVYRLIARRRAAPGGRDLVSMLLEARDETTGEGMTDRQLRDEVMTMLLAGHETTATALTWTFYLLARHPAVEQRLHDELDAVLAGRAPTLADLEHLPYARRVLDEAMRLYPPVWAVSRMCEAEDRVGPYTIPKQSYVIVNTWGTHHSPSVWERPDEFDPDRWLPERAASIPRFAYFPFLGGPRQCIGNGFAILEAHLLLATLAGRFRARLPDGWRPVLEPHLTVRPHGGMRVTVEERRQANNAVN